MKLTKCENGHFYDSDKYPECPYCNTDLLRDRSIVRTGEAEQPAATSRAVLVYDEEKSAFTLLPGSSQELCYLGGDAVLTPQPLTGGETLRMGGAAMKFVPFCGAEFHW